MSGTLQLLLRVLDEGYEGKSWQGPNLRGVLRGLDPAAAAWRPGPDRHSIRELVLHAAYWKYSVRRRLTGEKRGSFPLKGSNWFPRPSAGTAEELKADLRLLDECHRSLRAAVAAMPEWKIGRKLHGSRYDTAKLIYGVAAHDVYHTGQITLLKRLFDGERGA